MSVHEHLSCVTLGTSLAASWCSLQNLIATLLQCHCEDIPKNSFNFPHNCSETKEILCFEAFHTTVHYWCKSSSLFACVSLYVCTMLTKPRFTIKERWASIAFLSRGHNLQGTMLFESGLEGVTNSSKLALRGQETFIHAGLAIPTSNFFLFLLLL